jgi:hypothetical protein
MQKDFDAQNKQSTFDNMGSILTEQMQQIGFNMQNNGNSYNNGNEI